MKNLFKVSLFVLAMMLYSCGGDNTTPENNDAPVNPNTTTNEGGSSSSSSSADKPSQRVDMSTKGVGPITSVDIDLNGDINQAMADMGKEVYEMNCTACHDTHKTLVGPPQAGILERRTPEWVMNMIMSPEKMVQEDPLAKELFLEFNGADMSDQGITEEEARALLEYFRTL